MKTKGVNAGGILMIFLQIPMIQTLPHPGLLVGEYVMSLQVRKGEPPSLGHLDMVCLASFPLGEGVSIILPLQAHSMGILGLPLLGEEDLSSALPDLYNDGHY